MNIDRVSLRRRNLIPPTAMPYKTPNGPIYDSGEFEAAMDKALALADWKGFRQAPRGIASGAASCAASACAASSKSPAAFSNEKVDLRFEADGKVAIRTRRAGDGAGASVDLAAASWRKRLGVDRQRRAADRRRQRRGAGRHADRSRRAR